MSLDTLNKLEKPTYVVDVDTLPNEQEARNYLNNETGMRTYPKVFIEGNLVGGNSDLQALVREGKLK